MVSIVHVHVFFMLLLFRGQKVQSFPQNSVRLVLLVQWSSIHHLSCYNQTRNKYHMRTPNDLLAAAHNWNVVHGIVSILVQNHVS